MKTTQRVRRVLLVGAALLVLFSVVGFFVAPPVIKAQAEKRLSVLLDRKVSIGKVRLNPYALSVTIEGFDIRERNAATSFLGWDRVYVNFDALSSLSGDWVLSEVELDRFHAVVAVNADRSFNFSDLLAKFAPPTATTPAAPAKPARPVRVARLAVSETRIEFRDASVKQPFATTIGPLTFSLTEFRTVGDPNAPYRFDAVTEAGEKLAWRGTLAADPVMSKGEFAVENLVLKKYAPYLEDHLRAQVNDGRLSVRGRYEAVFAGEKRVLKLADGAVQLRSLQVAERDGPPVIDLPALDVTGIDADAVALKANVGRVAITGGKLALRREKDGALNVLGLLPPAPAAGPNAAATSPGNASPLPEVGVAEITVQDFAFDVTDLAAPRPARLSSSKVAFALKNFSLRDNVTMPIELALTWAPSGSVRSTGTIVLKPEIKAELKTEVTALDVLPLSPYLEQFAAARLTSGAFSTVNAVKVSLPATGPAVEFSGDISLERLGLVDAARNEELAGVGSLSLAGLKATTSPELAVSAAEIKIAAPYARVIVNADQSLNVTTLVPRPDAAAPATTNAPPTAAPPTAAAPKIGIGRVVISDGDFSFVDRSIEPNVRTALTKFGGTIAGLSSENVARADVDLQGTVDGAGPVAITGKLDPLGKSPFVDLKVDFKNVDLVPLSPYSGKFAGYDLARGKLVVDSRVLLDGRKVDATNVVTLQQFTFGGATTSKDATTLPVRLGVALLKDLDGKIVIDLPVQGSLDDPNFRIGRVVLRVVVNLLTKAAVSPFALLGSMFGGGGDELAFQEFSPGLAELRPGEMSKLETMTKALASRPGLSLALEGSYDAAADSYELKRRKLAEMVRRQVWEARHLATPDIPPPEQLEISPEEHAAMVKTLFDQKFPPGTQFGTPLPPRPAVSTPPPAPPRGFLARLAEAFTGSERRIRAEQEAENARREAEHAQAVAAATAAGLPLEEMTGRLAEAIAVDDNDFRSLASARAQKVRDYFITTGHIAADRLFLTQSQGATSTGKGPRVFLSLQ